MQSCCILFSALVGACLVLVPGNAKAENEQIQFLLPPINPGNAPQPMSAVDESNEEDKKLLLPLLALKPLVIASGLLAGNKLQKKKPSTPRPNNSVPPAENTVLVSIGDETDDQKEDTLEEEARKLLLPLLTLKPLLFASILAGSKLPASSIPKPGIGFTITKHESATTSPPVTTTPASTTTTTTQKPTSNTTTTPPIDNTCVSLNGFPCYRLPSGCVCLVSTQKPWIDAYNYCAANGRKLISIPNVARQLEISTYLPSVIGKDKVDIFSYIGFWTSGIYALTAYTWASIPQYFTYTNWIVGNPDITNLPRATCIRAAPAESYQWDDIDCGQFLPFICE